MASILEERDALKIRLNNPKARNDKLTIIDHAADTSITCTAIEAYRHLNDRIERGDGVHVIHVHDVKKAKEKKLAPGTQTKFTVDCGTNELYRQVAGEWERILGQVKNLSIARHMMAEELLVALKALSPTEITKRMFEGEGELPEWMR